jgi:hypothetical protein
MDPMTGVKHSMTTLGVTQPGRKRKMDTRPSCLRSTPSPEILADYAKIIKRAEYVEECIRITIPEMEAFHVKLGTQLSACSEDKNEKNISRKFAKIEILLDNLKRMVDYVG